MSGLKKIFTFDLDGNLFNTPTSFYFEKKQEDGSWKEVEITPYAYDANPNIYYDPRYYRFVDNDSEKSYQNFRDHANDPKHRGPDGLLLDIKQAIAESLFAPSLKRFKEALLEWQLFAILTARGHAPDNLKRMVKLINDELLDTNEKTQQIVNIRNNFKLHDEKISDEEILKQYFDYNWYLPVSNINWCETMDIDRYRPDAIKKTLAMDCFLSDIKKLLAKINKADLFETLSCWFSDDSSTNIKSMIHYFLSVSHEKKYLKNYTLYYTGHPDKYEEIISHLGEEREKYLWLNLPEIKKDPEHQILKISIES